MLAPDKEHTRKSEHDFTGERFIPQQTDPLLALEHYHRYCFASQFAKNRKVLDIACGEGYGSAFLAQRADEVVGIDSDRGIIDHATHKYSAMQNLTFKVGRCETSTEDPGSFDLVVCYETIEHLEEDDQVKLLNNIGRILKKDGLFIVSSPEINEYAAATQEKNQFHKHEMTLAELQSLLKTHFKHVHLCGQRVLSFSAIWELEEWQEARFRFNAKRDLLEEVPHGKSFSPPLYLIAICGNRPLPGDIIAEANSIYFDVANIEKTKNFYEWAKQMDAEAQKSREVVQSLEQQLEERASWAIDLQDQINTGNKALGSLRKELEERTTWAKDLQSEIKGRNEVIDSLRKELEERTSWVKDLQGEIESQRKELEERASWAKSLQSEIKGRNEVIDSLRKEFERRTTWAKDLQSEIESRNEVIDSLRKEFEERTQWALSLNSEINNERAYSRVLNEKLMAIASSPFYRSLAKIKLLPDVLDRR